MTRLTYTRMIYFAFNLLRTAFLYICRLTASQVIVPVGGTIRLASVAAAPVHQARSYWHRVITRIAEPVPRPA